MRWQRLATVAIVGLAVVMAMGRFHQTQDDAFISFRYARNLAETGALTWNGPGSEPVEGYSNFTWTLALAAAYAVGIGPWFASKLLGLACLVAAVLGAMRLAGQVLGNAFPWRLLAGLGVATSGCTTFWSVEGLETPLVAALVVWSLVFVVAALHEPDDSRRRRKAWVAGVALGVLGVSRPETAMFGVVALAAVAVFRALDRGRNDGVVVRMGVAFVVPVVAQLVFRVVHYGQITANTVYAKVRGEGQLWRGRVYTEQFVEAHGSWLVIAACALVAVAVVVVARRRQGELRAPVLTASFLAVYGAFVVAVGGDWMRGFRFFVHVVPLMAVLVTWALANVVRAVEARLDRRVRFAVVGAAVVVAVYANAVRAPNHPFGAQGAVYDGSAPTRDAGWSEPVGPHQRVARWLRENLAADGLVALSEAGIVPFHSRLPVLDYLGLNDRHVADLLHGPDSDDAVAEHVMRQQPRAIVMTGVAVADGSFTGRLSIDTTLQRHPDFAAHYELAKVEPLERATEAGTPAFAIWVRR